MSEETTPNTSTQPTPTTATSKLAKLKRWLPFIPIAAIPAAVVAFWPRDEATQPKQPDIPLFVVYSALTTNWEATVHSSHDPRLPVTVMTMTNGALATNMMNLNVRRAEVHRTSLLGFKKPDGGILPVAQAVVKAGTIAQTNGVDSVFLTEFITIPGK